MFSLDVTRRGELSIHCFSCYSVYPAAWRAEPQLRDVHVPTHSDPLQLNRECRTSGSWLLVQTPLLLYGPGFILRIQIGFVWSSEASGIYRGYDMLYSVLEMLSSIILGSVIGCFECAQRVQSTVVGPYMCGVPTTLNHVAIEGKACSVNRMHISYNE